MKDQLASRHIVLLGIGHTNAHILRMWGRNPIPDTDLTCISDHGLVTYSGMLPAVLAGQVSTDEMEIDLVQLCASVGSRLITNRVTGLDAERQLLKFADRPSVPFDVLSIGIGSVPSMNGVHVEGESLVRIKPMQTFLDRLTQTVHQIPETRRPFRVCVTGAGVAGIEVVFCLPGFLKRVTDRDFTLQLITRGSEILPAVADSTRRRVERELSRRNVTLNLNTSVKKVEPQQVTLEDDSTVEADIVIWATGASAPPLLSCLDLPKDDQGFLATDSTLKSTSGVPVFAVGDTGTILQHKLPKAGVFAVRQGPILWENIQRILNAEPLHEYVPQSSFLKLINLGNGQAVGEWKGFSFQGKAAMWLKDRIDSRFMQMFRPGVMGEEEAQPMQCRGCGCKLGSDVLDAALSQLQGAAADDRLALDDAAEIGGAPDHQLIASTDFFTSPLDDPFLFGRLAALHSASDIIATGARVTHALANVVLPKGHSKDQKQILTDFLEGARGEFSAMGGDIVGGHTIVGSGMEAGFTVIGERLGESLLRKSNLRPGDQLYLTKPLGIGILLAAHMRSRLAAAHYEILISAMLQRQHTLAEIASTLEITAGTDVTGFGLAGHLIEMMQASGVSAELQLAKMRLLPGTADALNHGIESTLAPANRRALKFIRSSPDRDQLPEFRALFDPQTCGGLLLGMPPHKSSQFLEEVHEADLPLPMHVGQVVEVAAAPVLTFID